MSPNIAPNNNRNLEEAKILRIQLNQARVQFRDSSTDNLLMSERLSALENILV